MMKREKKYLKYLTREELRITQLDMLKNLHAFCVEHGITYYLAYGTLLGAVRHKGFIPWDDDVDIMMPYEDWLKLRDLYKDDRYFVADSFTDHRHSLYFGRIYDGKTCRQGFPDMLGVFIDIYCMHGIPDCKYKGAKHVAKVGALDKRRMHYMKFRNWFMYRHIWPSMHRRVSYGANFYCRKIAKELAKYPLNSSHLAFAYGGDLLVNLFGKNLFGQPVLLPFEDGEFYVPQHYHEILTIRYGDYLQLPPEKDRHPYHGSETFTWK